MGKTSRDRPHRTTPQGGPIFAPPPMWAPTPAERLGNYPPGWILKNTANLKSPTGCMAVAGAVTVILAIVGALISHIFALFR